MVMNVLHLASEKSDNPDLRDRGYIYWRMLSTDPTATKDVVLIKRPDYIENLGHLLDDESKEIFSDAGIVSKKKKEPTATEGPKGDEAPEAEEAEGEDEGEEEPKRKPKKEKKRKKGGKTKKKHEKAEEQKEPEEEPEAEEAVSTSKPSGGLDDLLGLGFGEEEPAPAQDSGTDPLADIFGPSPAPNGAPAEATSNGGGWANTDYFGGVDDGSNQGSEAAIFVKPGFTEVLSANTAGQSGSVKGLNINGRFFNESGNIKLELELHNNTSNIASDFEILFNKNSFGVTANGINAIPISPGQNYTTIIDCNINSNNADMKNPPSCPYMVQTALKCSLDVFYFQVPCLLHVLFSSEQVNVTQAQCQQMINSINAKNSKTVTSSRFANSPDELKSRLKSNSLYFIYEEGGTLIFATSTINNIPVLIRISVSGQNLNIEE